MRFYDLLDALSEKLGGPRTLAESGGRRWPTRGVYFFFEDSEDRRDSGQAPRVVRVGTHALKEGSRSTLGQRLGQHRGRAAGGGNHRGSIFRLLIGQALQARGVIEPCRSWGVRGDLAGAARALGLDRRNLAEAEAPLEAAVTRYIGAMPLLWIELEDDPGPLSVRGTMERNAIALLSNYGRAPLDPPSVRWLGRSSNRSLVRDSGLWNQRHVEEVHDPAFIDLFEAAVHRTEVRR
jgi:hypothetical protein